MRRPSPSMLVALIALSIALGGTSYAVIKLPAKSVGNRELKSNAVTSAKIRARSVARSDLAPSARVGARGPRGATGPTGPAGGVTIESWKPLPGVGEWQVYGQNFMPPAYRKDSLGRVELRGLMKKVGTITSPDVIATLPAGYRPTVRSVFAVATGANPTGQLGGRVDVAANGDILWISGAPGDGNFTSLETIRFGTD